MEYVWSRGEAGGDHGGEKETGGGSGADAGHENTTELGAVVNSGVGECSGRISSRTSSMKLMYGAAPSSKKKSMAAHAGGRRYRMGNKHQGSRREPARRRQ